MPKSYVKWIGKPPEPEEEESREALARAQAETAFWAEHFQEFLKLYPDKFVAADENGVVAVDDDFVELVRKVKAKGRDPEHVYVDFLPSDPGYLIV